MVYLPDEIVRRLLSLQAFMPAVIDLLMQQNLCSGLVAEETLGQVNLAIKGGYVADIGYGIRIRTQGEGHYTTVVWDAKGKFVGTLDASSLTYLRTAALLLALPFQTQMNVRQVLVMGTGKLGTACIELLCHLYPQAAIAIWSRSQHVFPSPWLIQAFSEQVQWWEPTSRQEEVFDIVLTCTRASNPLPKLLHVSASYVGVGGAVNHHRCELPPQWIAQAERIYADDPLQAAEKCGDLEKATGTITSLGACLQSSVPISRHSICFVCGMGAIDIGLALLLLRKYQLSTSP